MQGAQVRSLVRELDPTCMPQLRVHMPQLRSQWATTKEPLSHNEGAHVPQLRSWWAAKGRKKERKKEREKERKKGRKEDRKKENWLTVRRKLNADSYLTPHMKVDSRSIKDQYGKDTLIRSIEKKNQGEYLWISVTGNDFLRLQKHRS